MEQSKIPVTVLTGFLGSGKTTLLNRILTENHGKKIAVIENEFGEVGVDNELVIGADEEIFEMNNGCICCTVRGDLIRILSQLTRRKDKLDYIIIETTGMANPSPVAQTFWVDEEMQEEYALDAIVTIVDAKHVWHHINDSDECKEQIAFADVLLLNKTDLVSADELKKLTARIRSMNGQAKVYQTKDAAIDLHHILNINAFDLDAKVEMNPAFLDEEYPYEWSGYYKLNKRLYTFVFDQGPDPRMDLIVLRLADLSEKEQIKTAKKAIYQFSEREEVNYATLQIPNIRLDVKNQVDLREEKQYYYLEIEESGYYGLFTQHGPDEFNMQLLDDKRNLEPEISHEHSHSHEHDESVISVGIQDDRPLSIQKVNDWISFLLDHKGTDIYRMKGIMNIAGNDERFVFQGVHMLFDGKADRKWKTDEKRRNQIIFIGKNLNREEILSGFELCVA
ncbi:CobW family GTP-binding protein [Mucilaginibacter sp. UYCu711]|uniref:CobW family GTP-binding protein n=1 Tax=Mucilaginibacter sp. UYCu711 TaxID=3156339 RepID=UPI003D247C8F